MLLFKRSALKDFMPYKTKDKTKDKTRKILNKKQATTKYGLLVGFIFCVLLMTLFLVYTYLNTPNRKNEIFHPTATPVKEITGITLKTKEANTADKSISLPVKLDPSQDYTFHFQVPRGEEQQYLAISLHYALISVLCEDKVFYTNSGTDPLFSDRIPIVENLIPIPSEYLDKELTLKCRSSIDSQRKIKIPTILVGSKHGIIEHYIKSDSRSIFSAIFLIILSILLVLFAIFLGIIKHSFQNILAMALFAFMAGIYVLSRTWSMWYYIANARLSVFLEYAVFMAMPVPTFLLFLNIFYENHYKNWRVNAFEIFTVLIIINLSIQSLLVILKITEFVLMQQITHGIIISSIIFMIISILTIKSDKIKVKKQLVFSILPLLFSAIFTMTIYYISFRISYVIPIILSFIAFLLVHFIITIKQFLHEYNDSIEHKFYSELAYTDLLTNTKNRNAFEKEGKKIKEGTKEYHNFCLFVLDMNHLKYINDNFGHTEGDCYLKEIGNILLHLEKRFKNILAYRYAGDEFIIINYESDKKQINKILEIIARQSKKFTGHYNFELSIAAGYKYTEKTKTLDFNAILNIAEQEMYKNKRSIKRIDRGAYEQ